MWLTIITHGKSIDTLKFQFAVVFRDSSGSVNCKFQNDLSLLGMISALLKALGYPQMRINWL
jgi:hypothetical protein